MSEKQTYLRSMITVPILSIFGGLILAAAYWNNTDEETRKFGMGIGIFVFLGGLIWLLSSYYALKEQWKDEMEYDAFTRNRARLQAEQVSTDDQKI